MQALYFAREHFSSHQHIPVFFSGKAHSAMSKSVYYLGMSNFAKVATNLNLPIPDALNVDQWPDRVPHHPDGTIDTEMLRECLRPFSENKIPAAIVLTVGTTGETAFDNVSKAIEAIKSLDFYRDEKNFWLHIDGAWCGPYARLLQLAALNPDYEVPREKIETTVSDFSLSAVKSITTSIHKWIPSPFPASVLVLRNKSLLPQNNIK